MVTFTDLYRVCVEGRGVHILTGGLLMVMYHLRSLYLRSKFYQSDLYRP